MRILIDTREQAFFTFERFQAETERSTLPTGDYSLPGFVDMVAIERKELNDLIACLMNNNRERFERELNKLRFYDFAAVVIESSLDDVKNGRYRSAMKPHAALQSIFAFSVRYRTAFIWAGDRAGAEYTVFSLLEKYQAEVVKRFERLHQGKRGQR